MPRPFESPSTVSRTQLVKSRAEAFNAYSSETVSRVNDKFGLVPSGLRASVETASSTPYTVHPAPYTLHPAPCTLHPTPYTLHPAPYTLHRASHSLHPTPQTLDPKPWTLHS